MGEEVMIKRALLISTAAVLAFCGGFAAYSAPQPRQIQEDEAGFNCHTDGNKICGPTEDPAEIDQRAEMARDMLAPQNRQYNCYILGCGAGSYALDDPRRIYYEMNEDAPYVHDDLIEGCEGDWEDPFCDIVRHYQDLRINTKAPARLRDQGQ